MNLEFITKLISTGESTTLELKKSTGRLKSACETVCAFLNTDGGYVILGVTDDLKIVGQEISDKTNREIGNELAKISPKAHIEVHYIPLENNDKQIIIFHITTDSTRRPYMYDGKAYLRSQSDTIPMPLEYLQQLTISNARDSHSWENQTLPNATLDDLDMDEIIRTVKEGARNGRIPEDYATNDAWKALEHLNLIENNKITYAAIILFGNQPERWFPQAVLKLARFRGVERDEFIDNKRVTGHAFKLLKEAMAFASTYLPIASTFPKDSLERVDTPLFPISALREALVNALCHRDYAYNGGSITFAIFDDRVEIWNYGLLPNGVELESLKALNRSVPRNPKIANIFYYHKLSETWGRGVKLIVKLCKEAGHPEPQYSQESGGTVLTLPAKQPIGNTSIQIEQVILSKRQKEILDIMEGLGECTTTNILEKMTNPPTDRTLRTELGKLEELKVVERRGVGRGTLWRPLP